MIKIYKRKELFMDEREKVLLTGLPVSNKMMDCLKKCDLGEYVDIEEIINTQEIKTAYTCVSHQTPTIELKYREDIEEHVFERLMNYGSVNLKRNGEALVDRDGNTLYNGVVDEKKRLDIVIGLPASGKSSAIVNTISYMNHSMVIDNDEAKKMFPEYNDGWGSSTVHKESQMVEYMVFRKCIQQGKNIVLPKVGSSSSRLINTYISFAKENGYTVNVHYVELDRNKALGRMMHRFIKTGRFLEPAIIEKYVNKRDGNKIEKAYEELKAMDIIDGYSKWNNDVQIGEKPVLIETNTPNDEFITFTMKGVEKHEHDVREVRQGYKSDIYIPASNRGDGRTIGTGSKRNQPAVR